MLPRGVPLAGQLRLTRKVVAVQGPDSSKYLNGLLTIRPPEAVQDQGLAGRYAAFLNPKGRILHDTFVYPAHKTSLLDHKTSGKHAFLLEVDHDQSESLLDMLEFYKLRADVSIKETDLSVKFVWNDDGPIKEQSLHGAPDDRAPGLGRRLIVRDSSDSTVDLEVYRLRRYLFGIPEGAAEMKPAKALPLEYCMDFTHGIDFDKGCYVGQELTIRTLHHGVIRKRVVPVVFTKGEPLTEDLYEPVTVDVQPGANIEDLQPVAFGKQLDNPVMQNPFGSAKAVRSPGQVISVLGNVGLALLRIDLLGHEFRVGEYQVIPLTPYWWPQEVSTE